MLYKIAPSNLSPNRKVLYLCRIKLCTHCIDAYILLIILKSELYVYSRNSGVNTLVTVFLPELFNIWQEKNVFKLNPTMPFSVFILIRGNNELVNKLANQNNKEAVLGHS